MGPILWSVLGLLVAGTLVYLSALRTRRTLPTIEMEPGERLPRTLLQGLARKTLFLVLVLTGVAAGMITAYGPQVWWDDDSVRLTVTFILLGAIMSYFFFTLRVRALESRDDGSFDERDSMIMGRSSAGVGGAMMTVIAVWMVALTESHRETHLLPTYFLYLIFWSCVMTNIIASVAGILLAYRRG